MARVFNSNSATDKTIRAIDRKREQERRFMLSQAFKNAEELSTRLVQRLIDRHIIETTSEQAMRDLFTDQLRSISNMEEFDIQFKTQFHQSVPDPVYHRGSCRPSKGTGRLW
jgi:hypothetical protein